VVSATHDKQLGRNRRCFHFEDGGTTDRVIAFIRPQ
jgi:hypothetical protein